ncbi:MAG: polysaccharide biosynthesis protein [Clostridia bacterium]|nr:polysaccharide biosynthesis protein [Clostridia bacterium]
MATEKKQSVLNGAMVLMFGVVLVKLIGVLFKIPLTDLVGSVGRGYFSSAYEVYTPIFAISMAGLPVAVSRMVAENVALEKYREARSVFKVSQRIFLIVGLVGTAILFLAAYPYTHFIAGVSPKSLPAVLCVAPSIFFCCYMSAYRGYYEGLRNMTPTAISQVVEALGKLFIGLLLAKLVVSSGLSQYEAGMLASGDVKATVFGTEVTSSIEANSVIAPLAAAGAVLGVTVGSILSNVFLMVYHKIKGDGFTRVQLVNSPKARDGSVLAKEMIKIAVPMVVSALILNITNLIDTITIQARLATALETDFNAVFSMHEAAMTKAVSLSRLDISNKPEVVKYLWGAYGSALDFRNLIPTITVQLGVSALPALAAAWAVKDKKNITSTIETVIRIGMLIALPAGIGMASLAEPILTVIYGRGNFSDTIPVVVPIMTAYGLATFVMAISTPVTNMLQAIGRTDIPVKSVVVGAICKLTCNFILVGNPKFNVYGAVAGTILFYVVIVSCNLISLVKYAKVKINWSSVFFKPFFCAALCGLTAFTSNALLNRIFPADTSESILNMGTVAMVVAVGLAVIVYVISLLLFKAVAREDVSALPKGEKIAKALEKYGLLG